MPLPTDAAAALTEGMQRAQARTWLLVANAAHDAHQARGAADPVEYAARVANAHTRGTVEPTDADYMREALGDALRNLSGGKLNGKQQQGERSRILGTARLFDLTEADLLEAEQVQDVALHEHADLHEADGVTWDAASGIARNIKVIGRHSRNIREYSDTALDDASRLSEGAPVYENHPEPKARGRKRQEYAGMLRDTRRTPDGARGNWHVPPRLREEVAWAIENNAPGVGMSINGQGKLRGRGKGRAALVESILAIRSVDFVAFPATTSSLAESTDDEPGDGLHVAASVEVVEATAAEMEPSPMELKEAMDKLDALTAQLAEVREAQAAEKVAREAAEADAAKVRLVTEAVEESGKTVKPAFRKILEKLDTKEEMLEALACVGNDKPATVPPAADGVTKPLEEGKDRSKKLDNELDALFESTNFVHAPGFKVLGTVGGK